MFSLWRILTGWLVVEIVMIVILLLPCDKSGQTIFRKILAHRSFSGFTAYVNAFYVIVSFVVTMLLYATSDVWTAQSVVIKNVDSNEVKLNYEYLAACLSAVLCFLICMIISINVKLIQLKKKHQKLREMLAEKALEMDDFSTMNDYRLVEIRTLKAAYDQKRDEICTLKAKISETKSKCEALGSTAAKAVTVGGKQKENITSDILSVCETLASLASMTVDASVGGEQKKIMASDKLPSKCETIASLASTTVTASVSGEQEKNMTSDIFSKCDTLASLASTKAAATVGGEPKKNIISSEIQSQCEILNESTAATNGGDIKKMESSPSSQILLSTLASLAAPKAATADGYQEKNNSN